MATETLSNITQDETEYARMCNLIKSQLDYQSGIVEARKEERLHFIELLDKGLTNEQIKERLQQDNLIDR